MKYRLRIIAYFCNMRSLLYLLFALPFSSFSQINNLVANPSFEDYIGCPNNTSQIDSCINWFQPLTHSSTDYFNVCCSIPDCSGIVSVPLNGLGFQYPRTGNAYSGIWAYEIGVIKEYLEGRLIEPLEANKNYCVELHYSIADSISQYFIVSSIGLFFSKDSIIAENNNALPFIPQVSENIINDVSNWVRINGSFTAGGGGNS